jgi:hypothetical protein
MVVGFVFDHLLLRQIVSLICILRVRERESQRTIPLIHQTLCKFDAIIVDFYPGQSILSSQY